MGFISAKLSLSGGLKTFSVLRKPLKIFANKSQFHVATFYFNYYVDNNVSTLNIIKHHWHVWYQERQKAAAAADNIVFCGSSVSRSSDLDSLKSGPGAGLKIAQTQTEKKISFLQQFRYCFMGNEKYRYTTLVPRNVLLQNRIIEKIVRKKQSLRAWASTLCPE